MRPPRTPAPTSAPPIVRDVLRRPGAALPDDLRAAAERRFRYDLSAVRIHTDELAAASARAVAAEAYTVGRHVVFARDRYAPDTAAGARLLAHELAHVVEQRAAAAPLSTIPLAPASGERHAESVEAATPPPTLAAARRSVEAHARALPPATRVHLQRKAVAILPAEPRPEAAEVADHLRALDEALWTGADRLVEALHAAAARAPAVLAADRELVLAAFARLRRDRVALAARFFRLAEPRAAELAAAVEDAASLDDAVMGLRHALERVPHPDRARVVAEFDRVFGETVVCHHAPARSLAALLRHPSLPRFDERLWCVVLLDHALNDAEHFLFERLAYGERQARRVIDELSRGPEPDRALVDLDPQWRAHVRPRKGWSDLAATRTWDTESLDAFVGAAFGADTAGFLRRTFAAARERQRERAPTTAEEQRRDRDEAEAKIYQLIEWIHRGPLDHRTLVAELERPQIVRHLELLRQAYRQRYDAAVETRFQREDQRRAAVPLPVDLIKLQALLTTGEYNSPYARVGFDILVHPDPEAVHRELYSMKQAEKRTLAACYARAFDLLGPRERRDADELLAAHLLRGFGRTWQAHKAILLLSRELTRADELFFLSWGIPRPDRSVLAANLDADWARGYRHFAEVEADWERHVRPTPYALAEPWPDRAFIPSMLAIWGDRPRGVVHYIADTYVAERGERSRAPGAPVPPDRVDKTALARASALLERSFDDDSLIAACTALGGVLARRKQRDPAAADAELRRALSDLDAHIDGFSDPDGGSRFSESAVGRASLLLVRGGVLSDADKLQQLAAGAPRGLDAAQARQALAIVTEVWARGESEDKNHTADLLADAGAAVVDPRDPRHVLRPGFAPLLALRMASFPQLQRRHHFHAALAIMLDTTRDRVTIGARRLDHELRGTRHETQGADLIHVHEFLKQTPDALRTAVIRLYAAALLQDRPGRTPVDKFVDHIVATFDPETAVVHDILDLARGPAHSFQEAHARAAARPDGVGLARGIAALFGSSGEQVALSLDMLQQAARHERLLPELARRQLVTHYGVATPDAAIARLYDRYRRHHDADLVDRKAVADYLGMAVEIFGRSLLVGVTGPAGIAGLTSALLAIASAHALKKGLLGGEYEVFTRANLGSLATEVSGTFFELKLEKWFEGLFETRILEAIYGKRLEAAGRRLSAAEQRLDGESFEAMLKVLAERRSALADRQRLTDSASAAGARLELWLEFTKKAASESLDSLVERTIAEGDVPSLLRLGLKTGNALSHAGITRRLKPITDQLHMFRFKDPDVRAWTLQVVKLWAVGPPPKASLSNTVFSTLAKLGDDPTFDWTAANLARKLGFALALSPFTAMGVGTAFTVTKARDARKTVARHQQDPDKSMAALRGDAKLSAREARLMRAYEAAAAEAEAHGRPAPDFIAWACTHGADPQELKQASKTLQKAHGVAGK